MKRALPFVLLLAACARDHGSWPSLAPRAAETRGRAVEPTPETIDAPADAPSPPPDTPSDAGAAAAWAKLRPRVPMLEAALGRTTARAAHAPRGSEAWAAAELELSRAQQLDGDLAEAAARFGTRAGTSLAPADLATARARLAHAIAAAEGVLAR